MTRLGMRRGAVSALSALLLSLPPAALLSFVATTPAAALDCGGDGDDDNGEWGNAYIAVEACYLVNDDFYFWSLDADVVPDSGWEISSYTPIVEEGGYQESTANFIYEYELLETGTSHYYCIYLSVGGDTSQSPVIGAEVFVSQGEC